MLTVNEGAKPEAKEPGAGERLGWGPAQGRGKETQVCPWSTWNQVPGEQMAGEGQLSIL